MTEAQSALINIIKCQLNGTECSIDVTDWSDVAQLALRHSVGNVLGFVSKEASIQKLAYRAIAQNMNQIYSFEEIISEFEKKEIYVLPLKGIKTKTGIRILICG